MGTVRGRQAVLWAGNIATDTTFNQQQTHTDNYSQPTADTYRQLQSANSRHIQTTTVSQQWTHTDNYSQPTVDT